MTIKTEQLKHSMEKLREIRLALDKLPIDKPHETEPQFRLLVNEFADATEDVFVIILCIMSEGI